MSLNVLFSIQLYVKLNDIYNEWFKFKNIILTIILKVCLKYIL